MDIFLLIIGSFIAYGALLVRSILRKVRKALSARPDASEAWADHAPTIHREQLDRFLGIYAQAFTMPAELIWRLTPTDPLNLIYDWHFPRKVGVTGSLEHSHFWRQLGEIFAAELEPSQADTTLGDIWQQVAERSTLDLSVAPTSSPPPAETPP